MIESLIEKLRHGELTTLEITPPRSASLDDTFAQIKTLKTLDKLDGFTVTDNPLAKLKYSSTLASIKLQQAFDKPVICTISMRDKNKLALQSELLGLNDFDIRAVLALTGDPARMSDQPNVKGVFECDSVQLLNIIKFFNAGVDFAGKPFATTPKPIYPFAVTNSYAKNFAHIAKKMHKKIENGAVGLVTQPVFDEEIAVKLLEIFSEAKSGFTDERKNAKLIFGIFPITSLKTAQFLYANVPGIFVPSVWIDNLLAASKISAAEEHKVGMRMTAEILKKVRELNPAVHIMTANKFSALDELLW